MPLTDILPQTETRAMDASSGKANRRIRLHMERRVRRLAHSGPEAMTQRLQELDEEWDIERTLEANAATAVLAGTVLSATVDRRFLLIPALVGTFLLQHSLQGWCPPLPLFRRMGVRTTKEINEERYALKALRGDFREVHSGPTASTNVNEALNVVRD